MENAMAVMWENLMGNHSTPFKSLFQSNESSFSGDVDSPNLIPQLSPLANSVVDRCSRILQVSTEELQHGFDSELPVGVKGLLTYARNLLEYCSYKALEKTSQNQDYLSDKEFRRLTYDMMLAWEAPSVECDLPRHPPQLQETIPSFNHETVDEDEGSLFYSSSTNMALQVDVDKTVGPEAFARIAPSCVLVADIITVHNLFDALTSSSGHRLHFLVYDRYLRSIDKVIKNSKHVIGASIVNLQLADGEVVIDVDGTNPTQPVLQHIGISAWPGRLILTNYALYFEPLGVGSYEEAVRYDLEIDMKQVIKPELTGPLEPVYFEFPEFNAHLRRDYWLEICLEIFRAHEFIRKYNHKEMQKSEVLARAALGIFRYRAVRDAFQYFSSRYKTLLAFNLAETLPGGDVILETLSSCLTNLTPVVDKHISGTTDTKRQLAVSLASVLTLAHLGFISLKADFYEEAAVCGDIRVGETTPLEVAVKKSILDTGKAQAAQETVDQVKVEGIDTNVAVMKELLFPLIETAGRLRLLASWKDFYRSGTFLLAASFMILRGWTQYILPSILVSFAGLMLWRRHFNSGRQAEAFRVTSPLNRNAVEQLLTLQEAIAQVESLIQAGNITLLKIRALLLALLPQATEKVALLLVFMAAVVAFVPVKHMILVVFVELYTREMPCRKQSSERWLRRVREWWVRIPAAPVRLVKPDDIDSKKVK
ncbi:uncharacterized protein LOC129311198 isoform X2 [Prosopis cineraria]|uniref:uncharacterized protein LOC129311198 isoform X2 n=1 Tax=Prosopis cineraria TaxID=364024 RepID=UPI00240EB842|nr:uncharacterized protein LOC129311198 isoform X2 [Prosopis cineraria]